ncbi:hypothetical protein [Ferruginibacter profundus]
MLTKTDDQKIKMNETPAFILTAVFIKNKNQLQRLLKSMKAEEKLQQL